VGITTTAPQPGTGSSFFLFLISLLLEKKKKNEEPVPGLFLIFVCSHTCGFARRLAKPWCGLQNEIKKIKNEKNQPDQK